MTGFDFANANDVKIGNIDVNAVYLGSLKVWERFSNIDWNLDESGLTLFFDDFPDYVIDDTPTIIQDEIDNPVEHLVNAAVLTKNTIQYNSQTIYLWKIFGYFGTEQNIEDAVLDYFNYNTIGFIGTTTKNYNELLYQSMTVDMTASFPSCVGIFSPDGQMYIEQDSDPSGDYDKICLLKVDYTTIGQKLALWFDDFNEDHDDATIRNYINDRFNINCNVAVLSDKTITYQGQTIYLWDIYIPDPDVQGTNLEYKSYVKEKNVAYLGTTTKDFNTLLSQSQDENYTSHFTSCVGLFSYDNSDLDIYISQTLGTGTNKDIITLLKVEHISNNYFKQ